MNDNMNSKIELLGLKKTYLASLLGVSRSYITNLLNGKIDNHEKMQKLKLIINEYQDAVRNNGLI
ncbi:hypothetical protein Psfp_03883 [Pelotomaculum sp. FP]|uniref:helix-turn-helix domain-containing protein n=1 Tax=Pelotomaculum sp. FP TaxID=261474 RepID=UPI0010FFDA3D|nr:helix-turn-helix domain-containing protein [Pelotomaculum sp. FP]TEB11754.1 hypothetical protein Psfp_03883 [Pelotomaculum sp. FP]